MANGNGGLANKILAVLSSLVVAGVIGGIVMYRSVGIAEESIQNLKKRQETQEQLIQKSLSKIDNKLDKIADTLIEQGKEAAKYHHKHEPPR